MRILYFISASGHGKGGHSHSLNLVSRTMSKYAEVQIIAVGPGESKVLQQHPGFRELIYTNGIPNTKVIGSIRRNVKQFNPDVIHCFDDKIYTLVTFCLSISGLGSYPVVLNKCGGPNLASFPVASHLILFSKENEAFYAKRQRFKNTAIHLIPNRVMMDNDKRVSEHFIKKDGEFFLFKISRIAEYYRKTLTQCIELAQQLWNRGEKNFRLFLIGTIDQQQVYDDLQTMIGELPVTIITNPLVTIKASAYLHYADAAICTGRGFMEACSLGIPVLAGSVNHPHPILVDDKNFNDFFYYNFSERAKVPAVSGEDQVSRIIDVIRNPQNRKQYSDMASKWFTENFDIEKGVERYIDVYKQAIKEKPVYHLNSNWRQLFATLRSFHMSNKKLENSN